VKRNLFEEKALNFKVGVPKRERLCLGNPVSPVKSGRQIADFAKKSHLFTQGYCLDSFAMKR
jgi:hypothetical protein